MLYLGACNGTAPPGCVSCLSACCLSFLAEANGLYASDVLSPGSFTPIEVDSSAGSWGWCSGMSSAMLTYFEPGSPIDWSIITISDISASVTIPETMEALSVCGIVTSRVPIYNGTITWSQDFSGLSVSLVGNVLTISGTAVVQGIHNSDSVFGVWIHGIISIGVLCRIGGVEYVVEVNLIGHEDELEGIQTRQTILPYACVGGGEPCGDYEAGYSAGYADGYGCAASADSCGAECTDCSAGYTDGYDDGRSDMLSDAYAGGYADGLACVAPSSPCSESCPDCSDAYSAGYDLGYAEASCG